MKYAVIGTGKTGSAVLELAGPESAGFNSSKVPDREKLVPFDCVVVFVPTDAAHGIAELLADLDKPVIWGTTGYKWPKDILQRIDRAGSTWIIGSNFSLGMNLVRKTLNVLGSGTAVLQKPKLSIREVHHVHKKDKPSGTALSWCEWLGRDVQIESERKGDVKGIHELAINTNYETIFLRHQSHDRKLFAEGALWAAKNLLENPNFGPGWFKFETFFDYMNDKISSP
ncbi:MAG: hypothetical protein EA411_01885 [Saprospirales bacterium]|nr:MAG: hypothetical protein EA411_01885 [Saprospirales bacterium]